MPQEPCHNYLLQTILKSDGDQYHFVVATSRTWYREWLEDYASLDMSESAVDLTGMGNGLSVLVEHDVNKHVAMADNIILKNEKLTGIITAWRSTKRAKEVRKSVRNGSIRYLSIGAIALKEVDTRYKIDRKPLMKITRWRPTEVSLVAKPADIDATITKTENKTVVIYHPSMPKKISDKNDKPQDKLVGNGSVSDTAPVDDAKTDVVKVHPTVLEKDVAKVVHNTLHKNQLLGGLSSDMRKKLGDNPAEADIYKSLYEQSMENKKKNKDYTSDIAKAGIYNDANVVQRYDFGKALHACISGDTSNYELGLANEVTKSLGSSVEGPGGAHRIIRPWYDIAKSLQVTATGTDGRAQAGVDGAKGSVPTMIQTGSFVDYIRNTTRLMSLGGEVIVGFTGMYEFDGWQNDANATWLEEVQTPGTSNSKLYQRTLSPVKVGTYEKISERAQYQTPYDLQSKVMQRQMAKVQQVIEQALLGIPKGSDDTAEKIVEAATTNPSGSKINTILNQGVGSLTPTIMEVDTNGKDLDWTLLFDMEEAMPDGADDVAEDLTMVMPRVGYSSLRKMKGTDNHPILDLSSKTFSVTGMPYYRSNNVTYNYTVGSSTKCFDMLAFYPSQMLYVFFGPGMVSDIGRVGDDLLDGRVTVVTRGELNAAYKQPSMAVIQRGLK